MNEYEKRNILITGIAGLLGSRLAEWILNNTNHNVIGIDDLSGGYMENVDNRVVFYNLDLVTDIELLKKVFNSHEIDTVYHMAAYAAEGLSPFIRRFNYKSNIIASVNLINESINNNIRRFVFTSSMAVYGDRQNPPFNEDMIPSPIDPYGVAKYAVEQDLKCAYDHHGLEYTIIRPHNVYGIKQNIWDRYRNVLGIWMYQIMNNKNPTIFGDGLQKRAFSYVDDTLEPMWNASQRDSCIGEIINLGGIQEHSIKESCEIVRRVTETNLKPVYMETRYEAKYAWSTWEKSVNLLDFSHRVNLEEGILKMWNWAQEQPSRERFSWKSFEIEKDVHEQWRKK